MMQSNGPVTLSLPPFRGTTRRILLTAMAGYLVLTVAGFISRDMVWLLFGLFALRPEQALHRQVWQFVTYPFVSMSLLGLLFSGLQVWFFGSALEEERGSRWFAEFFFVSSIVGGFVAALIGLAANGHGVQGFGPGASAYSLWPASLVLLVAFAYANPDAPLRVYFVLPVKAKYLAGGYLAIYVLMAFVGGDRMGALTAVLVTLAGYLHLRFVPRKGLRFWVSERAYGLRNDYYRAKQRKAAKKFAVYMKDQGKDVSIDESGRYVDPSGTPRDPNDRRWMN